MFTFCFKDELSLDQNNKNQKLMEKLLLVLTLFLIFITTKALECWHCENASSQSECLVTGRLQTCPSAQDICAFVTRQENGLTTISKHCKQQKACEIHMLENKRQCKPESEFSLCSCCCNENSCNAGNVSCTPNQAIVRSDCPAISNSFPHGQVSCSSDEKMKAGTVCKFQCTETGYGLHPVYNNQVRCMDSGSWDKPTPCCALPCPPNVLFDIIAMTHASSNETSDKISEVGAIGLRNIAVSPETGAMYAKVDFSGVVHESRRTTFASTLAKSWDFSPPPYINTADGLVNIGNALAWTLENMMGEENGERPRVRDVVFIGTDSESDDDVTEGVRAWLDRGALIYVLAFPNKDGVLPRYEKMLEITQNPANVVFYDGDSAEAADKIFGEIFAKVCSNICDHVSQS